ncbi:endonuclease I family protein [Streptomyces sp. NPDC018031]|uniref:endonuclease I family protein n=1 Tax=Streptomyces sp. NPDC018031 TaxID=3365033 RepID=UPI00379B40EA
MSVFRAHHGKPLSVIAVVAAIGGLTAPATAIATGSPSPAPVADRTPAGTGAYDDTYYRDAIGKTGPELKQALHTIISDQTKLSYDDVWEALKVTDEDPSNPANVILLYTGRSQSKESNGTGDDDWNREHVWAKSHGDFGTATGPGTDIHHLRPTDLTVNSTRGSKDFDAGGDELQEAPGNYTDDDSFEPRDAVKGDVARMILYMAVRYDGDDGFPDLEPNDQVGNGSAPHIGRLSVLKKWNDEDPPDDFESKRNQVIFDQYQHNRNPFIDHPEWVNEIWK